MTESTAATKDASSTCMSVDVAMLAGLVDVHSHLLPGIDDGCQSLEESIACARMMVEAGYTHSFCTPHIRPEDAQNTVSFITQRTQALQGELDAAQIPLQLIPGGEVNLREDLPSTSFQEVVTYGMRRKHVLVDLWADTMPTFFKPTIRWLQSLGLTVILAHPERMRMVQDDPDIADELQEMGLLLQGNLQCLADPLQTATRLTVERYLREDRYFMLGSDLHGVETLTHRLKGLPRAIELVGRDHVERLLKKNPGIILQASV